MQPDNLAIWNALSKTDPTHTKKFKRAGGFSGTAIKPIYSTRKMTEQFGPAGKGWGMNEPKFEVVPAGENVMVYCTVSLWWEKPDHIVYGVGGDVVAGKNKYGSYTDDEAFKKAYTDALSNAMKQIGMAADVHMGQHDDDKYVSDLRHEFSHENGAPAPVATAKAKTSRDLDWRGPMTKTALSTELRAFAAALGMPMHIPEELDNLLDEYASVIDQCKVDMPGWWNGDGMPQDFVPLERRIEAKRRQIAGLAQPNSVRGAA